MKITKNQFIRQLNGKELWTNNLGERKCVLFENGRAISSGKDITNKITEKNVEDLYFEYVDQELGPNWEVELKEEMESL